MMAWDLDPALAEYRGVTFASKTYVDCALVTAIGSEPTSPRRVTERQRTRRLLISCDAKPPERTVASRAPSRGILSFVEVRRSTGPQGGATIDLTAVELRALFNILSFVASGGETTDRPEREMAARLRAELELALGT
jgi:hypothetical protein